MRIEPCGSRADIRPHNAEFSDAQIIHADFRGDADAPVHRFEGSVAVKQIKGETERLIEEELLSTSEEVAASGPGGTDIARHRNFSPVDKSCLRRREVEKHLLAKNFGPNRLIALESVAVEWVIPAGLGIDVFAGYGIAPIIRLLEGPAIRHHVVHIGYWRQHIRSKLQDVVGIGIEAMSEFAIASRHGVRFSWQRRAELRLSRQP